MNINKTAFIGTFIFLLSVSQICSADQVINRSGADVAAKIGDHAISIDEFQNVLILYRKSKDMKKVK